MLKAKALAVGQPEVPSGFGDFFRCQLPNPERARPGPDGTSQSLPRRTIPRRPIDHATAPLVDAVGRTTTRSWNRPTPSTADVVGDHHEPLRHAADVITRHVRSPPQGRQGGWPSQPRPPRPQQDQPRSRAGSPFGDPKLRPDGSEPTMPPPQPPPVDSTSTSEPSTARPPLPEQPPPHSVAITPDRAALPTAQAGTARQSHSRSTPRRVVEVVGPFVHELAAPVEEVASLVGGFDPVAVDMREGEFADFSGCVG